MTLSMHEKEVYASGSLDGVIIIVRLPLGPDSKYEARRAAVGPFGLQDCERIRLLLSNSKDKGLIIVGQATNYLRKDGKIGGNSQWPIVLSVKEEDIENWIEWELLEEPPAIEDGNEAEDKKEIEHDPEVLAIEDGVQSVLPNESEAVADNEDNDNVRLDAEILTEEAQSPMESCVNKDIFTDDMLITQGKSTLKEANSPNDKTIDKPLIEGHISTDTNDLENFEPGDEDTQDTITDSPRSFCMRPGVGFRHYQTTFRRFP